MKVLRSRTIIPKTLKSAPSANIQPSTPSKNQEHPDRPISSPMPRDLSPLGLGNSSVRRRSLRLASKSSSINETDGSRSDSGKKKRKNSSPLVSDSSPNKSRVLDLLDSDSGNAETKKRESEGESIFQVSADPDKDIVAGSAKNDGIECQNSEEGGLCSMGAGAAIGCCPKEVVLKGVELDLGDDQAGKGGEKAGIQGKQMMCEMLAGKHRMETGADRMLDLNCFPDDGKEMKSLEKSGLGFPGIQSEEDAEMEGTDERQMMKRSKLGFSSGMNCFSPQSGRFDKRLKGAVFSPASSLDSFSEIEEDKELLYLRSGARIPRRRIKVANVDSGGTKEDKCEEELVDESVEDFSAAEPEMNSQVTDNGTAAHGRKRFSKEQKAKALLIEQDWLSIGIDANKLYAEGDPINSVYQHTQEGKEKMLSIEEDWLSIGIDANNSIAKENLLNGVCHTTVSKKRHSKEEKGKGKLIESSQFSVSGNEETMGTGTNDKEFNEEKILQTALGSMKSKNVAERKVKQKVGQRNDVVRRNKERFLATAKHYASRFAYFQPSEEDNDESLPVLEAEVPMEEAVTEDEDWPGPFSTAMKMIEERAGRLSARLGSLGSVPSKAGPVIEWTPSRKCDFERLRPLAPSLHDICLNILCRNAEAITSLEGIPDALRSKLSHLLCDSRKMNHRIMRLIISGSPSEICIKDCSCITEEQFQEVLGECNTEHLRVLQLDLCGPCMPDYVFHDTLAQSTNGLSALTTISLRGAYRLSDGGLSALVSSAPSLRSVNLVECSLLTSTGINIVAENLRSVLMELRMDNCQNVDALSILPALKKLKHLEILSVAGIRNVCDKFVCELIPVCGPNMKELVFTDCGKLTDISLKAIAENCSGLRAIDLFNLKSLTDTALQHLANGCRSLQVLRLCRNGFSDEGIAAFLEASGESLIELSLNNIKEVANNTAIALAARCSKTLSTLDLSWCRKLMDEALGLIVDKCLSLSLLKLFGCTQVTDKFLDGHSNPHLKIIGLKLMPVLEHLCMPDAMQSATCY